MKCFLPDLSAFSQTSAEWQADTCKFVQYLLIQGFKSPRAFFYSGKKTSCIFPLLSFSLLYCQITLLPISCPLPSPPVCCSVLSSQRDSPVCVWGPTWIHHARRQTERQHEGGGGGSAAVCHTAEPSGGWLWIRSGGFNVKLLRDHLFSSAGSLNQCLTGY